MENIDTLLMLLENPTRRRILRRLTVESHYPLQLAKELKLSTQAVMKQLDVLEKFGLVKCTRIQSNMGPSRKCYFTIKGVSLRLDMAPNLFETRIRELPSAFTDYEALTESTDSYDPDELMNVRKTLMKINRQISVMDKEIFDLMRIKEEQLGKANQIMKQLFEEYDEREVLHYVLAKEDFTLSEISESLGLREERIRDVLRRLSRMKLIPEEDY